jgi:hypothetical protein
VLLFVLGQSETEATRNVGAGEHVGDLTNDLTAEDETNGTGTGAA